MNKTFKKVICTLMCGVVSLGVGVGLTGCGPRVTERVDETKTQLYVGIHSGGYGVDWIKDLKEKFEAYTLENEISYQDGRTGVQLMYTEDKSKYETTTLYSNWYTDKKDIFMISGQEMYNYLSGDLLYDLTDIATETLTKYGETRSIEDKMNTLQKDFYSTGTKGFAMGNNKYYALPVGAGTYGVIYDVDLFEDRELYLAKNGAPSEALIEDGYFEDYAFTGDDENKSAGPDGEYGTVDDGFPVTLDEFNAMMYNMKENESIDPLTWTGQHDASYAYFPINAFMWNYQGADTDIFSLGSSAGVTLDLVTGFNSETGAPIITETTVNNSNLKEYTKNAGLYYGLQMMESMVDNGYLSDDIEKGLSHTMTQLNFLNSKFGLNPTPIAMMAEGDWWEEEAEMAKVFDTSVDSHGDKAKRENRRFGLFVMPTYATLADLEADLENGGTRKVSTIPYANDHLIVRKDIESYKEDLVKDFIQFTLSDVMNVQYTIKSGAPRALDYEIPTDRKDEMSYFAQQSWEVFRNSNIRYAYNSIEVFNNTKLNSLKEIYNFYTSYNPVGLKYGVFTSEAANGLSARAYFEGMYKAAENL